MLTYQKDNGITELQSALWKRAHSTVCTYTISSFFYAYWQCVELQGFTLFSKYNLFISYWFKKTQQQQPKKPQSNKATIKALTTTALRAIAKQFQSWYRVRLTLNTFILFKHHLLASTMYWILFCHYKPHIESRVANNQNIPLNTWVKCNRFNIYHKYIRKFTRDWKLRNDLAC